MKQIAYFGRKNHYGLRLYKNRKNRIDCVSGYLSRYINIDKVERRGSSSNIYIDKPYINDKVTPRIKEGYARVYGMQDRAENKRIEATFKNGKISVKLNEPIGELKKVSIYTTYEYGTYYYKNNGLMGDEYVKDRMETTTDVRPKKFDTEIFDDINAIYELEDFELNINFAKTKEVVDGEITHRFAEYGIEDKPNKATGTKITAFICDIDYNVLVRSLYARGHYVKKNVTAQEYKYDYEYIEQCRAKYFYFVIEGTSMKREKTEFRFILDANGELVEPSDDFVPHYEKKLRDNPLLTANAVYHSPEGDIPLYKWVAKNLLTKYKKTRYSLEFEKALTPLYLTRDFKTEAEYRLDRLIRNGDYISITDEFGSWMGGTLGQTLEQSFFDHIKNKYDDEAKANEIKAHPLIYRVMNTNTKVKNDVGFQKCECLEVVDLKEIEEIFI